jgi:signal transduction histidine kinase
MTQSIGPDQVFKVLFEACPHPYLVILPDQAFTIVAASDLYLEVTGTTRAALLGRGVFECFPDNPADPAASGVADLRSSLQRVLHDRVQDVMGIQKYDIPDRDGQGFVERYWSPVNTPVFDGQGEVAFLLHHVEDVTAFMLAEDRSRRKDDRRAGGDRRRGGRHRQVDRMRAEVLRRAGEVKQANRELKAAKEALEQRESEYARLYQRLADLDQAKTEFFANVSHEFRTPLTLMLAPLEELLKLEDDLPSATREQLWLIHRNAMRLLKLVNSLLEFSRIEANRARPNLQPTDLAGLTADLTSNFRSACESAGLTLDVDCPPLPWPVQVDREMWEKIVLNLLSNAFKFTSTGGILVSLRSADGVVELTVRDTGIGIPEADLPNLFERFFRAQHADNQYHEGIGIGLALVKELVQLHDGTVLVDSQLGQGSAFTVRIPHSALSAGDGGVAPLQPDGRSRWPLPVLDDDRRAAERSRTAQGASEPAEGPRRERILLADDNADVRSYLQRVLENADYRVDTVADGDAALASCLASPPDLVLCDVMMPRLGGLEFLRRLRATPAGAAVPAILLSARAGDEAKMEGFAAGADDYLLKPFSVRKLLARVDGAIRLADVRRRSVEYQRQVAVLETRVAEQEIAARALRIAREEAEHANLAKSRFLAAASHDLRQPLQGLFLFVARLAGCNLGPKELKTVASIERALESLKLLLDALLDVSRLDAGIIVPNVRDVPIGEVLDVLAAEYHERAVERQIAFRVVKSAAIVHTDPPLLGRLLRNLVENAFRFTERGRILVTCRRRSDHLLVQVWDTGLGIPEAMLEEIFTEFVQVGNVERDRDKGMGLGLAIVQRLSRLLGHRVSVRSTLGRGSVFSVEISLAESTWEEAAEPAAPATGAVGRGMTALIIDDDAMVNFGLSSLLENWGCRAIAARTAADAIEKLAAIAHPPAVVIADYRLPQGETGVQAIASVRRHCRLAIPAVLLTGDTSPDVLRDVQASGLPVLHKPILANELRQAIDAAVSGR